MSDDRLQPALAPDPTPSGAAAQNSVAVEDGSVPVLRCERCGLLIRPRARFLGIEFCPRCLARAKVYVRLRRALPPDPQLPDASTG